MRVAIFDTHRYERQPFESINPNFGHHLDFYETRLIQSTAKLAEGCPAICAFVNDELNAATLSELSKVGVKLIALRSAGFNHVDLRKAEALGLKVVRVPAYSPHAVAEHAVALISSLNRKIPRAVARVREHNFSLEGLVGFDLFQKKVGVLGAGKIGRVFATIMKGFGCEVFVYDPAIDQKWVSETGVKVLPLADLISQVDILSLHLPLSPATHHLIDTAAIQTMKPGVMVINTSRGGLIDAKALVEGLKSGRVGSAGLDVYEEEENLFFQDHSDEVLQDDTLARLLSFTNVIVTAHQAFLTHEALHNIVTTTLQNISDFEKGVPLKNEVRNCATD